MNYWKTHFKASIITTVIIYLVFAYLLFDMLFFIDVFKHLAKPENIGDRFNSIWCFLIKSFVDFIIAINIQESRKDNEKENL